MPDYDQLLKDLRVQYQERIITEEVYLEEKTKLIDLARHAQKQKGNRVWGMRENTFLAFMHLSLATNFLVQILGCAVPIILWAINKNKNKNVNRHGRNIINFIASWSIYFIVAFIFSFIEIGVKSLMLLILLSSILFVVAAIKAYNGEFWKYPLTISFMKIDDEIPDEAQAIEDVNILHQQGIVTEEIYPEEKQKLIDADHTPLQEEEDKIWGMKENTFIMLMHLSQMANVVLLFPLGCIIPLVMWAMYRNKNENVDKHGKNIINLFITWLAIIAISVAIGVSYLIIGKSSMTLVYMGLFIGIPLIWLLLMSYLIFIIIATVKASNGKYWRYPIAFPIFRIQD